MKKETIKNIKEEPVREIIKIPTRFPVGIMMQGDDFNFECEVSLEMAGHIMEYIGRERERIARAYPITRSS